MSVFDEMYGEGFDFIQTVLGRQLYFSKAGWTEDDEMTLVPWNLTSADDLAELYATFRVIFGSVEEFRKAMRIRRGEKDICLKYLTDEEGDMIGYGFLDEAGVYREYEFDEPIALF